MPEDLINSLMTGPDENGRFGDQRPIAERGLCFPMHVATAAPLVGLRLLDT